HGASPAAEERRAAPAGSSASGVGDREVRFRHHALEVLGLAAYAIEELAALVRQDRDDAAEPGAARPVAARAEERQVLPDAKAVVLRLAGRRRLPPRLAHHAPDAVVRRGLRMAGLARLAGGAPPRDGHRDTLQLFQRDSFRLWPAQRSAGNASDRVRMGTLAANCAKGAEIAAIRPAGSR